MNMDVTKSERHLITEAVLTYVSDWKNRVKKCDAVRMLMEIQRTDRPIQISVKDARFVVDALECYSEDTTELERRFKEAIDAVE